MQGTRVRALVREDPTCCGATKPVCHNYWACALELASHNYWARTPRARAPQQEKPRQWEACAPQWRVAPALHNWRKPAHSNKDPMQPKVNKLKKKKPNGGDSPSTILSQELGWGTSLLALSAPTQARDNTAFIPQPLTAEKPTSPFSMGPHGRKTFPPRTMSLPRGAAVRRGQSMQITQGVRKCWF